MNQNKTTTTTLQDNQLSNNNTQVFKSDFFNRELVSKNKKFTISIRGDGYINATQLCKAGGKLFADYKRQKQTNSYLQALKSNTGIPITKLMTSIQAGNCKLQGTWVHRKVAYHLTQWISPEFSVQVSNWLDELLITGKVELGKEKPREQIEDEYQQRIKKLEKENFRLRLQKHRYLKFKMIGPAFYIIVYGLWYSDLNLKIHLFLYK